MLANAAITCVTAAAVTVLALSAGTAWAILIVLVVAGLLLSLVLTWALAGISGREDGPDPTRPPATTCATRPAAMGFPVVPRRRAAAPGPNGHGNGHARPHDGPNGEVSRPR